LTTVLESKILERFNGRDPNYRGDTYNWGLDASRFTTKTERNASGETVDLENPFPRQGFVPEGPRAYFGYNTDVWEERFGITELRSFGIWGRFDRLGYNWIDIFPVGDDESATTIPIPGRLISIDMWVWGANFRYDLEAYFRDQTGIVHAVKLGTINYAGWRNLRADIPPSIPQARSHLIATPTASESRGVHYSHSNLAVLEFVKFRLWTQPTERVDNFFVYFNQFRVVVDAYETPFDGDILADPVRIQEFWNGGE